MAKEEKLLGGLAGHLEDGETPQAWCVGAYETKVMGQESVRTGVLAATDRRLVFFAKKLTGFDFESFPFANVTSFEQSKGMMGGKIQFIASGNTVSMKWIKDPAALAKLVAAVRAAQHGNGPVGVGAPAAPDAADQIRSLAALRDEGLLTSEEFETKKRGLLERM